MKLHQKYFIAIFKKAISNAAEKVFINANIKYCLCHFKRVLEIKKKKELCGNKVKKIKDLYIVIIYYFLQNIKIYLYN